MTKDEIIRMAREAGAWGYIHDAGDAPHKWQFTPEELERFFQAAYAAGAAAEREACAKVCDIEAMKYREVDAWECAAAIRARGNK